MQSRFLHTISKHNPTKTLAIIFSFVVVNSVANHSFTILVVHSRSIEQHHLLGACIVPTRVTIYICFVVVQYMCWANNTSNMRISIIKQRVGA